jgi:hypothetical protein
LSQDFKHINPEVFYSWLDPIVNSFCHVQNFSSQTRNPGAEAEIHG